MSGEDMLQMALRMAEMSESGATPAAGADQPHLDLEDISHGCDMSTMLAAQQQAAHAELLAQQQMAMVNKKARQDKRQRNGDARGSGKKRPKVLRNRALFTDERGSSRIFVSRCKKNIYAFFSLQLDERGNVVNDTPLASSVPAEPLDAHMVLKYTYGVNAWRHWVVQKNAEIEATAKAANFDKSKKECENGQ